MSKTIITAKNTEELEKLIKKNIQLQEDEKYEIKVIKKPFKFLFLNFNGKYEVTIIKKNVVKENKNKVKEKKVENTTTVSDIDDNTVKLIQDAFNEFVQLTGYNLIISRIRKNNTPTASIEISLKGKDCSNLTKNRAELLESLEKIFSNIQGIKGKCKIFFDADDYKQKRVEYLKNLAHKKAKQVQNTKENVKLNYMNARDRKIIHEVIGKYSNIKTQSYGEDPKRYMVIKYVEKEDKNDI